MAQPVKATADRFLFTRWWWGEAFVLGVCVLVLGLSVASEPSGEAIRLFGAEVPGLCVFKRLTGYSCPGCGLTRSFSFMGNGQIWAAFSLHPLGPPIFLAMVYQVLVRAGSMAWGPTWIAPWRRWWRSSRAKR